MEKTRKITSIILWVLMILSVVTFVYMILSIDDEKNPSATAVQAITMNLNWAIALFAIAAIVVLLFALFQIVTDKRKLISFAIVLGLFAIVFVVSYALASSEIPSFPTAQEMVADGTLNETISRWVDTGLHVTYILSAGALLSIAGFNAANIFKR